MKMIIIGLILSFSAHAFDHSHKEWNEILQKNTKLVKSQVLVDYKGIKKSPGKFNAYLKSLSGVGKKEFYSFNKKQQLSFWINAYNAFTVKIIVDNYPVKSIKDIGSIFSSTWSKKFISLLGKKMSLDQIEHGTIRKEFKEPRIHFAVNCASIGCPSLYREAFIATKLEEQLQAATVHFMNNKEKNYLKKDTYYISKIFDWYGEDFDKYTMGVKNFVGKHIKSTSGKKMSIKYLDYDWNLNEY